MPLRDLSAGQFFIVADPTGLHAHLYRLNADGSSTRFMEEAGEVVEGPFKRLSSMESVIPVQLEG